MINCTFENGSPASLRHVVVNTILLNDKDQILLVKRAKHLLNGERWTLVGGFLDRDEDTREACMREVKEETGYESEVGLLLRIAENPDRPKEDRQNVAFIYISKALEKTGEMDDENTEMKWFNFDNLPSQEDFAFDHFENVNLYLKYRKQKFEIPVIGKI